MQHDFTNYFIDDTSACDRRALIGKIGESLRFDAFMAVAF